jgi:hypothetical protein
MRASCTRAGEDDRDDDANHDAAYHRLTTCIDDVDAFGLSAKSVRA